MKKDKAAKSKKSKSVKSLAEIPSPESDTKRPVQTEIPGTERVKIRAIDDQTEEYVNLRDKMQTAVKVFKEAKTKLTDLMHKHADKIGKNDAGEMVYRYDDMQVFLTPKEEVLKVKHVSDDEVTVGEAPADHSEGEV